jgi:hypothetical protein
MAVRYSVAASAFLTCPGATLGAFVGATGAAEFSLGSGMGTASDCFFA